MIDHPVPAPPFLVFPDQEGGFFVFQDPLGVWAGGELADAEAQARSVGGYLAGGLQYGPFGPGSPGWWGVFSRPAAVTRAVLESWADPCAVVVGALSSSLSEDEYGHRFAAVRTALAAGESYQANLTFPIRGKAVSGPPFAWPSALRLWLDLIAGQGREASFAVLGTKGRPGTILVSASPELFFRGEGASVETRPMKGTALRHADPVADAASRQELEVSLKNRAENLMVTDMLRNDLGRLAVPGSVTVPRLFEIEGYPTVWQMTSTVRAELAAGTTLSALMAALFPCASITGAPKVRTQQILEAVETSPRGWYTGTLGWYRPGSAIDGPGRSRFSVLIRTLVFEGTSGDFTLGVGGGIVWDSTPGDEWAEAWAKTRFLDPVLRRFSLTEAVLWDPDTGFFLLEDHEARLTSACRAFGGSLVEGQFTQALDREVRRLVASGTEGPLKLRASVDPGFNLQVEGESLSAMPEVLSVSLAARPFGPETLLVRRFKTTARRVYEEAKVPGADQTLHYNERGELTESTSMTLVVEKDGQMFTPALAAGLLDGTFRSHLVRLGDLIETTLWVEDLADADRIWLINSVRRWKPVRINR